MTEPTRDALHAETLAWLAQCERTSRILANSTGDLYGQAEHAKETRIIAHAAACVRRVPELEAEVERLRAKAAIVDAMERGEVRIIGWSDDRTRFGLFVDTSDGGEDEVVGPSVLAAYAAATREGTQNADDVILSEAAKAAQRALEDEAVRRLTTPHPED